MTKKQKKMIISKEAISAAHLYINGFRIERVKQYCYLGTVINVQWDNTRDIKYRIKKARTVFNN